MIAGTVTDDGVPIITLLAAGQTWPGIIDTGFNGDMELPDTLHLALQPQCIGHIVSVLAGGQRVEEDVYLVDFPFDGHIVRVEATFVPGSEILIGTRLLQLSRLEMHFPAQTVLLERVV